MTAAPVSSQWNASTPTPTNGLTVPPCPSGGAGWGRLTVAGFSTLSEVMKPRPQTLPAADLTVLKGEDNDDDQNNNNN